MVSCNEQSEKLEVKVFETSAAGNKMKEVSEFEQVENKTTINIDFNAMVHEFSHYINERSAILFPNCLICWDFGVNIYRF